MLLTVLGPQKDMEMDKKKQINDFSGYNLVREVI